MAQLILLLIYLTTIAIIVWQAIVLVRDPASRSPGRIALVAAASALITGVIYFGVLH
ncbi:MAG: hypothetical protein Q7T86_17795 [Hyphomicrobiaceae bacterium]|jgi:hypothetical protein|nr:hypothetical protein [Hyphomicrobiaceae bacterium]